MSVNADMFSVLSFFQYHQVYDDHFISAVVLSLILAALFGLIYLLMIPQYVHTHTHTSTFATFVHSCNVIGSVLSLCNEIIKEKVFSLQSVEKREAFLTLVCLLLSQGDAGVAAAGAVCVFPCGLCHVPAPH